MYHNTRQIYIAGTNTYSRTAKHTIHIRLAYGFFFHITEVRSLPRGIETYFVLSQRSADGENINTGYTCNRQPSPHRTNLDVEIYK